MRSILLLSVLFLTAGTAHSQTAWKLVWSDEFNAPALTPPDPSKWNYDLGGGGWGNGEIETYTNSIANAFQDGKGNLVIRAIRDSSGKYTSARLQTGSPGAGTRTADLSWQYGRIQARIKLPYGKAIWPAFWMLGANIDKVNWPTCGEVDIMENFGTFNNNASLNNGTVHGPGYSGGAGIGKSYQLPFGEKVNDDFHVYTIEWAQDSVEFLVDGASYHKVTPASLPAGKQWVFNAPFFLLLNLAIGGPTTFLGTPDPNAPFAPQDLLVDYVRIYQAAPATASSPAIDPGRVLNAASFSGSIAPGSLAVLYGDNLGGATVTVNGVMAPQIYNSATQIDFQIPWATAPGPAVEVKVTRDGLDSAVESVTVAASAAPSMFLNSFVTGVAWVTGSGCETAECAVAPGVEYQLWANGLGPKNTPQQDGVPSAITGSLTALEVEGGSANCHLTIGGQPALVEYCGAAPGEIIDQVNFIYPPAVSTGSPYVDAMLTVNGITGRFRVPAPVVINGK